MRATLTGITAALICWACAACNSGKLDSYGIVNDLRVLGLQASPAELVFDAPGSMATQVSALVVDPQGGPMQYTWSLCPLESTLGCNDFDVLKAQASPGAQAMLGDLRALRSSGTAQPVADANSGALTYTIPPFDLVAASVALYGTDRTSELVSYFMLKDLFSVGRGSWPMVMLTLTDAAGETLTGVKRLVLGIRDPARFAILLESFDIAVCPTGKGPDDVPGCLLAPRSANQNPAFRGLQWSPSGAAAGPFTDISGVIPIKINQEVRLRPLFAADAAEPYQIVATDLQARRWQVENHVEALSVGWFATAGKLRNNVTWPKFTGSLDNTFTAPDAPVDALALWLVARDQRGGTAWEHVVFHVTN